MFFRCRFRTGLCGFSGYEDWDRKVKCQDASRDYKDSFYITGEFLESTLVFFHALGN